MGLAGGLAVKMGATLALALMCAGPLAAWDLDTITVTGTRVEKRLADTPVVTEVITAEEIQASGASDVAELLTTYGVIWNQDTTHGDQITLQGLGGGRVLLLVDGRRVAGRVAQNVEGDSVPLLNVERIEVVRGPQSALYGSDAMGGVINIITRQPEKPRFSAQIENTSLPGYDDPELSGGGLGPAFFQRQALQLGLDAVWEDWATSWNLSGSRSDYYWDQKGEVSILPRLWRGRASVEAVRRSGAGTWTLGTSLTALDQSSQTDFTGSLSQRDLQRAEIHGRYQTEAAGGSWDVQLYQDWYRRATGTYVAGTDTWSRADPQIEFLTGFEVWHTRELTASNILTLGVQGTVDALHETDLAGNDPFVLSHSVALVAQDEQYEDGVYSVVSGLRLEHGSGFGVFAAPKISAQYTLAPGWRLLGGAGTGYRVPSVEDRYYDIDWPSHPVVLGNADLKPEYSLAGNAGVEWVPGAVLSSRVNAYHQELFDEIAFVEVGTAPDGRAIFRNKNIDRTARTGIDAEVSLSPLDFWTFGSSYSWIYAVNRDTRKVLTETPEHSFRASVRFARQPWGLSANFGGHWDSTSRLTTLNAGFSQSWDAFEVYGRGENLTSVLNKERGPFTPVSVTLGLRYYR